MVTAEPNSIENAVMVLRSDRSCVPGFLQDCVLNLKKTGLYGRGTAQPPQWAGQSPHQFALDRRLCVEVGGKSEFESLVVFRVFQARNDRLCGQAMPDSVAPSAFSLLPSAAP